MSEATYSVWVGGGEINDYYLTKEEADRVAEVWLSKGYDEVAIENIGEQC